MAVPQKFDDLLAELRSEVNTLDTQKSAINGELITLEARKRHLEGSISKLTQQADAEKSRYETSIAELDNHIRQLTVDKVAIEKSIVWLEEKQRLATQAVANMQQSTDEDIVRFNGQIEAKKVVLTEIETTKAALQADCDALGQEIAGRTKSLAALDRLVADNQAETDEKIQHMTASVETIKRQLANAKLELDNKLDEVEETEKKAADAQKLIVAAQNQHREFLAYEERAKKALEARESAVLEREHELEAAITRARRRDGILDKL